MYRLAEGVVCIVDMLTCSFGLFSLERCKSTVNNASYLLFAMCMHVNKKHTWKILDINVKFNLYESIKENGPCGSVVVDVFLFLFFPKIFKPLFVFDISILNDLEV